MRADAYLRELEAQLALRWLSDLSLSTSMDVVVRIYATRRALQARMRDFLQLHGWIPSLTTMGHMLPATGATLMDVLYVALIYDGCNHRATTPSTTLWTLSDEQCSAALCRRVPSSKLLLPHEDTVSAQLIQRLWEWLPDELRVRATDSREAFIERLSRSTFFDHMDKPRQHRNQRRSAARTLHDICTRQPRRATFSVQVAPRQCMVPRSGQPEEVVTLYSYYGFKHARVMPPALFDLGVAVWRAAYDALTDVSRLCPFTHCQVLIYYECFGSRINQHRDNSNVKLFSMLVEQLEAGQTSVSEWDRFANHTGQVAGSDVVIYTLGTTPMQMQLRFPHADALSEERSEYVVHASFKIPLAAGTVFVWTAIDDIFFTHEAAFECEFPASCDFGESGWREAYVFRHVNACDVFHCSFDKKHELVESDTIVAERLRRKRKQKAKQRADLFKSMC